MNTYLCTQKLSGCVHRREILLEFFTEKQIIQRAKCTVFLNLVDRHLLTIDRQFNKASPTVKLMRTDFPNIFRTTIWTFHILFSPYPFTELMAFSRRCSLMGGTITALSPIAISVVQGSHLRPSNKSDTKPSEISNPSIVLPFSCSK